MFAISLTKNTVYSIPKYNALTSHVMKLALSNSTTTQTKQAKHKASEKHEIVQKTQNKKVTHGKVQKKSPSFASLLRNSDFMEMANFKDVIVNGVVIQEIDNVIYVDFGGKFECVCRKPENSDSETLHRGSNVTIMLQKFELSERFLGSVKDTTLLEADGVLLRINN